MSLLEWYLLFAISGGITSGVVTFFPILSILKRIEKEKNITHTFIQSPVLSFVTWISMATLLMPLVTLSILSKKENSKFIESVTKTKVKQ